jgi:2OG-Fe(II) oxygenase superfamily
MNSARDFTFEPARLARISSALREVYASNQPFPHVVLDNFLDDPAILDAILEEFPKPGQIKWQTFDKKTEVKLANRDESQMGAVTRHLLHQLNSSAFCGFLEDLTGIQGIIPDPHFEGGGLHQIQKGGLLKIHADFNWHERLRLDRRINAIIYLNKNWKEEYGGHLELWKTDMSACGQKVLPIFNRMVIFSTTSDSYHGHPEPLTCPEGWTRKSLALYYYSNGRPASEKRNSHTTIFQARPHEKLRGFATDAIKAITPPLFIDGVNAVRKSLSRSRS